MCATPPLRYGPALGESARLRRAFPFLAPQQTTGRRGRSIITILIMLILPLSNSEMDTFCCRNSRIIATPYLPPRLPPPPLPPSPIPAAVVSCRPLRTARSGSGSWCSTNPATAIPNVSHSASPPQRTRTIAPRWPLGAQPVDGWQSAFSSGAPSASNWPLPRVRNTRSRAQQFRLAEPRAKDSVWRESATRCIVVKRGVLHALRPGAQQKECSSSTKLRLARAIATLALHLTQQGVRAGAKALPLGPQYISRTKITRSTTQRAAAFCTPTHHKSHGSPKADASRGIGAGAKKEQR